MADGTVRIEVDLDDKGVAKGVGNVEKSLGGIKDASEKATVSIGGMLKAMGLVSIAKAGIDMVKKSINGAISRYDILSNSEKVFANMGFEAKESSVMMDNLVDSITGLPTPLEDAVQGVQNISAANGDLDKSQKIYSALNNSILGVGKSGEEVNSAVEMLTRGINSGTLHGQEFNTLMNTMGPNMTAVAKEMGYTTGELQKGLSDGSISVEEFTEKLIEMDSKGGGGMASFQKQAKDMTAGIGTNMKNMATAVTRGMANVIGAIDDGLQQVGLPTIGEAISNLGDLISDVLGKVAEAIPPLIKKAVEFYNAIEPWLPLIGAVVGAVTGMIIAWEGFNKVKAIIMGVKETFGILTAVLSANPFLLVIGGAIAGAILIYTYWDEIREFFSNLWTWLKETGATVWDNVVTHWTETVDTVITMWESVKEFFSNLWEGIKEIAMMIWKPITAKWAEVVAKFQEDWNTIKEFFSALWEGIKEIAMIIWEPIKEMWIEVSTFFSETWTETVTFFKELWTDISVFFSELWAEIVEIFMERWNAMVGFFTELWAIISEIFLVVWEPIVELWAQIVEGFMNLWNTLKEFFSGLWGGITEITMTGWEAIKAGLSMAWDAIKALAITIFENIKQNIQNAWENISTITFALWDIIFAYIKGTWDLIKNTIQTMIQIAKVLVTAGWEAIKVVTIGVWDAIKTAITTAWDVIKTVITTVLNVIKTIITTVWNVIKGVINVTMSLIKGDISGAWNAIKGIVNSVLNGIRSIVTSVWNAIKSIISSVSNSIKSTVSSIFNSLKGVVSSAFNGVRSAVSSGMKGALNIITNMGSSFKNAGSKIIGMLADGITGAVGKVTGAISGVMGKVRDFLPFSPSKEGPLTDIDRLDFGGPVSDSIDNAIPKIQGKLNTMLNMPDVQAGQIVYGAKASGGHSENITNNNDNGVKLIIENIENHSDSDIPRILEESAWIINGRKRGSLNG